MPAGSPDRSPYEAALETELDALHPRLRAYFGAIPPGFVGVGHGEVDLNAQSPLGTQNQRRTQLLDQLSVARRFEASFHARVVDGALILASTGVSVRVGRRALQKQCVDLVMTHPAIGRVYEFAGTFSYQLRARNGVKGTPGQTFSCQRRRGRDDRAFLASALGADRCHCRRARRR